jgi:hypothetical protein
MKFNQLPASADVSTWSDGLRSRDLTVPLLLADSKAWGVRRVMEVASRCR